MQARRVPYAVELDCGTRLRGSIDLVERHPSGLLRITDHKSGKSDGSVKQITDGGKILQPVLYALAAEKLFAGDGAVAEGLSTSAHRPAAFWSRRSR